MGVVLANRHTSLLTRQDLEFCRNLASPTPEGHVLPGAELSNSPRMHLLCMCSTRSATTRLTDGGGPRYQFSQKPNPHRGWTALQHAQTFRSSKSSTSSLYRAIFRLILLESAHVM